MCPSVKDTFITIRSCIEATFADDLFGNLNKGPSRIYLTLRSWQHYEFELDAEKLSLLVRDWNKSRVTPISALSTFRDGLL
jgi:hypothetical protein